MLPRFFRPLIVFFCLGLTATFLPGQDSEEVRKTDPPTSEAVSLPENVFREQTVYIPYDKLQKVFEQPDRGVFLPYDEFKKLWDAAKIQKTTTAAPETPVAAMITEMSATATASEEIVRVEASIFIELFKDGWHEIPLRLGDAAITKAMLGEESARILGNPNDGYRLLVEKKKSGNSSDDSSAKSERLELKLHFAKSIEKTPGRNSVSFTIPLSPLSRWKVVVPESGVKIDFSPMIAASEGTPEAASGAKSPEDGEKTETPAEQTVLEAFLGSVPKIDIAWTPKAEGATGLDALTSVQLVQRATLDEGILRTSARFEYSISRSSIASLSIRVPADQKVVSVFDPNIRKWDVQSKDDGQTVLIDLFEPARNNQLVLMELEKLFEFEKETDDPTIAIPKLEAVDVGRQQGILVVRCAGELNAETVKSNGLLRMDASELPDALRQSAEESDIAYRISSTDYALELGVNKVESRITATAQIEVHLTGGNLRTSMLTLFNIERAGVFQFVFEIPAGVRPYSVQGFSRNDVAAVLVDSFLVSPVEGDETKQILTVNLKRKASGRVGLKFSFGKTLDEADLRSPTGNSVDLPVVLPMLAKGFAERFEGKLLVQAGEAFRLNPLEPEGLQAISIQQILGQDWMLSRNEAQLGFLFGESSAKFTLRAERRKPQLTVREVRTVRIDDGALKQNAKFHYDVRFSGVKSLRIDVPEDISGRLEIRGGDWRESAMVPQPEDVAKGYVAWEFSTKSELLGSGVLDVSWEDEIRQLDIGKSIPLDVPRLIPARQQPSDRIWGQIILSKSQSIDLGESEETQGLKPIDPQYDVAASDRVEDAVAAFEFHGDWQLKIIATRYRLEEVKRTSIERGLIRANLLFSKNGTGISAQALFRIRSVQQRLEFMMPQGATISDIRLNGQSIVLESDAADKDRPRYMVPLNSVPPDTPFLLDVRYSVEPPCKNQIGIPSFPGVAAPDGSETQGPAIQKVHLAVYLPEHRIPVGFRGDWSKEFSFRNNGKTIVARNDPDPQYLVSEFFGGMNDDFSVTQNVYVFSAMQPRDGDSLRLTVWKDSFGAGVFALIVLLGVVLLRATWFRRVQIVIGLAACCILAGFYWTTFASLLLGQSAIGWGILIVLGCWGVQSVVRSFGVCRAACGRWAERLESKDPQDVNDSEDSKKSADQTEEHDEKSGDKKTTDEKTEIASALEKASKKAKSRTELKPESKSPTETETQADSTTSENADEERREDHDA